MLWFCIIDVGIRVGIDVDIGFNEVFLNIFLIGQPRSHTDGFFTVFLGGQDSNWDHQTSAMMPPSPLLS